MLCTPIHHRDNVLNIMTMTRPCIALVEEPWSSLPLQSRRFDGWERLIRKKVALDTLDQTSPAIRKPNLEFDNVTTGLPKRRTMWSVTWLDFLLSIGPGSQLKLGPISGKWLRRFSPTPNPAHDCQGPITETSFYLVRGWTPSI